MRYSVIGAIVDPSTYDEDGGVIEQGKQHDGYHVNMLDIDDEYVDTLAPYIVQVNSPAVVFAGRNDTVFLRFADREEWLGIGIEQTEQ